MPRRTGLVVPVPEAEPFVGELRLSHDPSAALGAPAHVTVLFPFAAPEAVDESAVSAVLEPFRSFPFSLASVELFPDGVTYLAPQPPGPFAELTRALAARFPEHPPYGGAYEAVIPHLTVAATPLELTLNLPIACVAREVLLLEEGQDGRWRERRRFRLQDDA